MGKFHCPCGLCHKLGEVFAAADAAARQYYMNVVRLTDLAMKQNENKE